MSDTLSATTFGEKSGIVTEDVDHSIYTSRWTPAESIFLASLAWLESHADWGLLILIFGRAFGARMFEDKIEVFVSGVEVSFRYSHREAKKGMTREGMHELVLSLLYTFDGISRSCLCSFLFSLISICFCLFLFCFLRISYQSTPRCKLSQVDSPCRIYINHCINILFMELISLKSRLLKPKNDLIDEVVLSLKKVGGKLKNGDVLVITSKVASLAEGKIVPAGSPAEELKLAKSEADHWLGGTPYPFAVKDGILIPRSGIDASNAEPGTLILWPSKPWQLVNKLRTELCKKYKIIKLGIILADSTCRPLRWGVSSIAMSWAGFRGIVDKRQEKDLYGTKLAVTQEATADALAAAAGVLMGSAAERVPFVLIRRAPVNFTPRTQRPQQFQPADDLFASIYTAKFRNLKI